MREKIAEKNQVRVMLLPEYGKQKLLAYADSFKDLADMLGEGSVTSGLPVQKENTYDRREYLYQRKMSENREMMAGHLTEMAQIMTEVAKVSFAYTPLTERKTRQITKALKQEGLLIKEIYYIDNEEQRLEIGTTLATEKGKKKTAQESADLLSVLFDKRMVVTKDTDYFVDEKYKEFHFIEEPAFSVLTGVAKAVKENEKVSGDNYAVFEPDKGSITVLLSDGMGSGEKACEDSQKVLDLTERLLDSGFSAKTAVQMVNSSLSINGVENNMSTLDICYFDLYQGICQFTKVGAATSYIKRANMVEQISSRNLPLGIFGRSESELVQRKLMDGDYIIMISDGILDGLAQGIGEEILSEIISRMTLENPKEIANYILNYVIRQCRGSIRDDMTVIVIGIWENS